MGYIYPRWGTAQAVLTEEVQPDSVSRTALR